MKGIDLNLNAYLTDINREFDQAFNFFSGFMAVITAGVQGASFGLQVYTGLTDVGAINFDPPTSAVPSMEGIGVVPPAQMGDPMNWALPGV